MSESQVCKLASYAPSCQVSCLGLEPFCVRAAVFALSMCFREGCTVSARGMSVAWLRFLGQFVESVSLYMLQCVLPRAESSD